MNSGGLGALFWLVAAVLLVAGVYRARRQRRTGSVGAGAAGAIYDMLNEDKRHAIEIIVEQRAEARDPEDKEGIAFAIEHSVEAEASLPFAWAWRTDVTAWDDPPATFTLDGPFAEGAWGTTRMPDRAPVRWQVRDVRHERAFTIAVPLDGAVLAFEWRFDRVSERRTRLTQRIVLSGEHAAAHVAQVRDQFAPTLAAGMNRLAAAMSRAELAQGGRADSRSGPRD
jgi:hypothetical protein